MVNPAIHPAPQEIPDALLINEPILRFFHYKHLPAPLAAVSQQFCQLALFIVTNTEQSAERTVALRKLLESKDAAVRACI